MSSSYSTVLWVSLYLESTEDTLRMRGWLLLLYLPLSYKYANSKRGFKCSAGISKEYNAQSIQIQFLCTLYSVHCIV